MTRTRRAGEPISVHIHISDYDHDSVEAMDDVISQLSTMIAVEKMRCGGDNMITYHLHRALEYADRERKDAIKRIRYVDD